MLRIGLLGNGCKGRRWNRPLVSTGHVQDLVGSYCRFIFSSSIHLWSHGPVLVGNWFHSCFLMPTFDSTDFGLNVSGVPCQTPLALGHVIRESQSVHHHLRSGLHGVGGFYMFQHRWWLMCDAVMPQDWHDMLLIDLEWTNASLWFSNLCLVAVLLVVLLRSATMVCWDWTNCSAKCLEEKRGPDCQSYSTKRSNLVFVLPLGHSMCSSCLRASATVCLTSLNVL